MGTVKGAATVARRHATSVGTRAAGSADKRKRGKRGGSTRRAAPKVKPFDMFEGVDDDDRAEIEWLITRHAPEGGMPRVISEGAMWLATRIGSARRLEIDSVAHRLRCAEVTGDDPPPSTVRDRQAAMPVVDGAPVRERMVMSPLVRKALCAMPARALWEALSEFDAEAQRADGARALDEARSEARRAIRAWCAFCRASEYLAPIGGDAILESLAPGQTAVDFAVAVRVWHARMIEDFATMPGTEGALRRRWSTWLVAWLTKTRTNDRAAGRTAIMSQVEVADLILESAEWPMPPCPTFAGKYQRKRAALIRLLDVDAGSSDVYVADGFVEIVRAVQRGEIPDEMPAGLDALVRLIQERLAKHAS